VEQGEALVERIRRGVVGDGQVLDGPFGPRRITYADWTASGRALDFVEDAIRDQVLPWYANTHTESSGTGRHTTRLREQARQAIHQAVGGTDQDLVIFTGAGATAAVAKLAGLLDLDRWAATPGPRPLVLVGPFEHHSNLLPWRESAAEVVAIGEDANGQLDLADLEAQLTPPRRAAAGCRELLGRLQRHRHPHRRRPGHGPAAPPRRPVGLGLLGRCPVSAHPDGREPPRGR
jgi:selenocysteine lyase/cysteine desulfurase